MELHKMWICTVFLVAVFNARNVHSRLTPLRNVAEATSRVGADYLQCFAARLEFYTRPPELKDVFRKTIRKMDEMNTAGMTAKEADRERMNIFYGCLFKWKARVVLRLYIEKALGNSKLGEVFKASEQLSNEICKKSVGPPAPRPQPPCYGATYPNLVDKVQSIGCTGLVKKIKGKP